MKVINNDATFKQSLQELTPAQQRIIAARFVEHVLPLSNDERINRVVHTATSSNVSNEEISGALKSAKAATFDSHTRCGSEGNWTEQAGYFVARAAVAAITAPVQSRSGGPAWQAAMSCRMAQTSILIDDASATSHAENEWQYNTLSNYLAS